MSRDIKYIGMDVHKELLRGRTLEPVLLVYQALGGEEGSAASDARPRAQRIRLEAVEYAMALQHTRSV